MTFVMKKNYSCHAEQMTSANYFSLDNLLYFKHDVDVTSVKKNEKEKR